MKNEDESVRPLHLPVARVDGQILRQKSYRKIRRGDAKLLGYMEHILLVEKGGVA